jgi:hypothetical protein
MLLTQPVLLEKMDVPPTKHLENEWSASVVMFRNDVNREYGNILSIMHFLPTPVDFHLSKEIPLCPHHQLI